MLTTDDGALLLEYESLQEKEDDLQARIDKINEQVEKFTITLLLQFAAMENAISKVNSLLQALDANQEAQKQFSN